MRTPEEDELAEAQRQRDTPDVEDGPAFQPLNASVHFDRVLYDGGEFGTAAAAGSPEEEDFLGLPGLLDPDQVRTLLRKRQQSQLAARTRDTQAAPARLPAAEPPPPVSRQQLAALRKELTAWSAPGATAPASRTGSSTPNCAGPAAARPLPQATADQIRARIATIRRWALSGR